MQHSPNTEEIRSTLRTTDIYGGRRASRDGNTLPRIPRSSRGEFGTHVRRERTLFTRNSTTLLLMLIALPYTTISNRSGHNSGSSLVTEFAIAAQKSSRLPSMLRAQTYGPMAETVFLKHAMEHAMSPAKAKHHHASGTIDCPDRPVPISTPA